MINYARYKPHEEPLDFVSIVARARDVRDLNDLAKRSPELFVQEATNGGKSSYSKSVLELRDDGNAWYFGLPLMFRANENEFYTAVEFKGGVPPRIVDSLGAEIDRLNPITAAGEVLKRRPRHVYVDPTTRNIIRHKFAFGVPRVLFSQNEVGVVTSLLDSVKFPARLDNLVYDLAVKAWRPLRVAVYNHH